MATLLDGAVYGIQIEGLESRDGTTTISYSVPEKIELFNENIYMDGDDYALKFQEDFISACTEDFYTPEQNLSIKNSVTFKYSIRKGQIFTSNDADAMRAKIGPVANSIQNIIIKNNSQENQ